MTIGAAVREGVFAPVRSFLRGLPTPGQLWAGRDTHLAEYHAIVPSVVEPGDPVRATLLAWDGYERLVHDHDGRVRVGATDPAATVPDRVRFSPRSGGVAHADVRFETPGLHYLTISGDGKTASSNPVLVTDNPECGVYWGDLHLHSQFSDGAGSMARGFEFGRDVMDLDVVAYTDHDTMGFFIPPSLQRWLMDRHNISKMKAQTEQYHDPDEFVTLYGYEWTKQPGAGGHINCYFDHVDGAPFIDSHHPESDTYEGLWQRLREWREDSVGDVVTIPHHPAEAMYPFDFAATEYDDELAPLVEIYSQWGSSECPADADNPRPIGGIGQGEIGDPGHYVRDALALGHRVGLIGGSDFHGPRPGHSILHVPPHMPSLREWVRDGIGWGNIWRVMDEESYPGGLTAFLTDDLTRSAVFETLRDRRVYGTTQPHRILVQFAINGRRLRDPDHEIELSAATGERRIAVGVAGSAPIDRVEIIKNGSRWQELSGHSGAESGDGLSSFDPPAEFESHVVSDTVVDTAPVTGVSYDDDRGTDADYYYLRVHQTDDGLAWAGPLWVSV